MRRSLWIFIIGLKFIGMHSTIFNVEVQNKSCFPPIDISVKEAQIVKLRPHSKRDK